MTEEFKLSDNECNILTIEQLDDVELFSQDVEFKDGSPPLKEIIFHNGESIIFKKGFFTEDIKEAIKLLKANIKNKLHTCGVCNIQEIIKEIDERFGPKLT